MHRTLKKEATKPAARNLLQQQARFDNFIDGYNRERPISTLLQPGPIAAPRTSITRSTTTPTS